LSSLINCEYIDIHIIFFEIFSLSIPVLSGELVKIAKYSNAFYRKLWNSTNLVIETNVFNHRCKKRFLRFLLFL